FIDYASLQVSNFTLVNAPVGLNIESVNGINPQQVSVNLAHDGSDFDADINNFYLTILSGELIQTETGSLATSQLGINAFVEIPAATLSADSVLTESRLDARTLTVNLSEESFLDYTSLGTGDFNLINAPAGLTIGLVTGLDPDRARITLDFDESDFDANIPDFHLEILSGVLFQTPSGVLSSSLLNIFAFVEQPEATLTADSILTEYGIDVRELTITLSEEQFNNYLTLTSAGFGLVNPPAGLSIENVTGISPTGVLIELQFDETDFETNILDFRVNIANSILKQTTTGVLSTSPLIILAYIENPVATLSADSILTERRLDYRTLMLDLTEEEFTNPGGLQVSHFNLANAPAGLSIESVTGISITQAELEMQFTGADFDTDLPNFAVDISASVLKQTLTGFLRSSPQNIQAYVEVPVATLTSDSVLTEQRLDSRTLYIDLEEENFVDYTSLSPIYFNLVNAPAGLNVLQVNGVSPTRAELDLLVDQTDFDTPITDLHVSISAIVLVQTTAGTLETNQLSVQPFVESPMATMTADPVLSELTLDNQSVEINLTEEEFLNVGALQLSDFTLQNGPAGLGIESISVFGPTRVIINLQFDRTDFDADSMNFHILIRNEALKQSSQDLATNNLTIYAFVENPSATIAPDATLTEQQLDVRYLTLDLFEEEFLDFNGLAPEDFTLNNAPVGLDIESVTGIAATRDWIDLVYTGIDFDDAITDFSVSVDQSVLKQTGIGILTSSAVTILPYIESPVAALTPDATLQEQTLGARTLTIDLIEEEFWDYLTLQETDFTLVNGPAGLAVGSV
ncbi:hypothetical protein LCGC14_1916620, partial [marine sediment metagenome]